MEHSRPHTDGRHIVKGWSYQNTLFELYRYAPGRADEIPSHRHEDYQLFLSLDGPGEYFYRGRHPPVSAGSLSVIHPGETHAARDREDRQAFTTFRVMYADPTLLQTVATEVASRRVSALYFGNPNILDRALAQRFLALHRATETSATGLGC